MKRVMKLSISLLVVILAAIGALSACAPASAPAPPQQPAPASAPAQPQQPAPASAPAQPQQPAPAQAPKAATAPSPTTKPKVIDLLIGATSLSSSSYIKTVSFTKVLNREIPGMRGTVVETGAPDDNIARLKRGDIDVAGIVDGATMQLAYNGELRYEGDPFPELRALFSDAMAVLYFIVRADSDIYQLSDLDGEKVFFGATGSGYVHVLTSVFTSNGLNVERAVGSYSDGVAMMKDRRIVGFFKGSAPFQLDATLADIAAFTDIRIIPFTEAEFAAAASELPSMGIVTIPAGAIVGAEEQAEVTTISGGGAVWAVKADFSADLAYQMVKAFNENWDEIRPVHGGLPPDPILAFMTNVMAGDKANFLIHAGMVRYLKEIGVDVPAAAIPPEFK